MVFVMKHKKTLLIILSVSVLVSLACNFGRRVSTPAPTVPVSTEAVENLEESLEDAFQEAQESGEINLVITEDQLTSAIAFELEKNGTDSISDIQIRLQDGQVQMTAAVNASGLSATASVIMDVSVDAAGRPVLNVVSANLGPFPVPEDLVSEIEVQMNQAFQEQINETGTDVIIESIVIEGGSMRITGRTKS
jgi:uncharacterized protein YpmS